ncbi:MAG: sulfurtransferase-like selenium metabolism protein YedF [Thermodesulforhabdaceae bacterium]
MERSLDCRGLACPAPVLKTKEAIEEPGVTRVVVRVDNPAARDNVTRFLTRSGYRVTSAQEGNDFVVIGEREGAEVSPSEPLPSELTCAVSRSPEHSEKTLVLIATDRLGRDHQPSPSDNSTLGEALMKNFIATLKEMGSALWRIVFLNSGVRLTIDGSPVLDAIAELEKSGVSILVCGTCLNFYGLLEKKKVGETTNMLDIVTSMQVATKVITIT